MSVDLPRNVIIPNLVTVGNGICGFAALWLLSKADVSAASGGPPPAAFAQAAWLILLGMLFDVFDGKLARMAGGASALGAQLDSLSDLVTFGLVPAIMMLRVSTMADAPVWWQRAVWFFSLAYFLGALLRLARFTAENEPDEGAHLAFKGLPTPGAAGCVASLVIFYGYISEFRAKELEWVSSFISPDTLKHWVSHIPIILPCLGLVLGYTMVSNRLVFEHVGSRVFNRKHSFDFFVYLIFGAVLAAVLPEIVLPLLFLGYLVYTPSKMALARLRTRKHRSPVDELSRP
jgi:CDP-diacylglycerol--serine O-phosphatidyltransferase